MSRLRTGWDRKNITPPLRSLTIVQIKWFMAVLMHAPQLQSIQLYGKATLDMEAKRTYLHFLHFMVDQWQERLRLNTRPITTRCMYA